MSITTRECSLAELKPEFIKIIERHLTSDDNCLICFETKYDAEGTDCYHVYTVSQHRIVKVSCSYSFWGRPKCLIENSIPLVDIVSIIEHDHGWWDPIRYVVKIRERGQGNFVDFYFESRQTSLKFTTILREAIEQVKANESHSIPDIAEQLAKLAKLYQVDQAITKEEYEAAKRKLLG